MNLDEANKLWYEFKPIEGIKFRHNDSIKIVSGENTGNFGSVISLVSLEPVSYLIELSSGKDIVVLETDIEIVE